MGFPLTIFAKKSAVGRILAIDYGLKRVGLAVTDPQKITTAPIGTYTPQEVFGFIRNYCAEEDVDVIVVGLPVKSDDRLSPISKEIKKFGNRIRNEIKNVQLEYEDEYGSSEAAVNSMIIGGASKKYRRDKKNIDKLSAVIILQSYLSNISED